MEIPPEKSETMAFLGQDPVISKTAVDNNCLQQVKNFKYLGCEISYEHEKDIQQKLATVLQILGILINTFKPTLVQKCSRIRVYNALAPPLLYGSEIWTIKRGKQTIYINQDEFFRRTLLLTIKGMKKFWKS
jgi:hypothetical protein